MRRLLRALEIALGPIDALAGWISGGLLLVVAFDLFINSVTRSLLNVSMFGSEELARVLIIWLTFLAAYVLVRRNAHITIDLVMRIVPRRAHRVIATATSLISAVTCAYLGWIGYLYSAQIFGTGQVMTTLDVPAGLYYLPVPISGALMAIAFLLHAVRAALYGEVVQPGAETVVVSSAARDPSGPAGDAPG